MTSFPHMRASISRGEWSSTSRPPLTNPWCAASCPPLRMRGVTNPIAARAKTWRGPCSRLTSASPAGPLASLSPRA